jgi:hypothetical protein
MKNDLRKKADEMTARFVAALGGESAITEPQRYQARRAGELTALADRFRQKALDGVSVELADLSRIEGQASDAVNALGIAPAGLPGAMTYTDTSKLSDDELLALEAMLEKAGAEAPPDMDARMHAIAEKHVGFLRTECESLEGRLRSEQQMVVIRDGQIVRLRIEVDELRAELEALRNPKPPPVPPSPSNIVPLRTADTLTAPIFG